MSFDAAHTKGEICNGWRSRSASVAFVLLMQIGDVPVLQQLQPVLACIDPYANNILGLTEILDIIYRAHARIEGLGECCGWRYQDHVVNNDNEVCTALHVSVEAWVERARFPAKLGQCTVEVFIEASRALT